ncbi:hypothetical protein ACH5RR_007317 [Cinchona calisaya]|uniref:Uncharacterized protein n=1 Tax=Cinchona calisaya TaxID=153742 RepID=A0ABD3ARV0_9GENT
MRNPVCSKCGGSAALGTVEMERDMRNPVCGKGGGPVALGEIFMEEYHLRVENARLREEINRLNFTLH